MATHPKAETANTAKLRAGRKLAMVGLMKLVNGEIPGERWNPKKGIAQQCSRHKKGLHQARPSPLKVRPMKARPMKARPLKARRIEEASWDEAAAALGPPPLPLAGMLLSDGPVTRMAAEVALGTRRRLLALGIPASLLDIAGWPESLETGTETLPDDLEA